MGVRECEGEGVWGVRIADSRLPNFFGTQSVPSVNFDICTIRYGGKVAKRVDL